jgi:adenosylcobinamide-phosphate synthase
MAIPLVAAFILDLFIGDPPFKAHPVRLIGSMLDLLERWLYPLNRKCSAGLLMVVLALLVVYGVTGLLVSLFSLTLPLGLNPVAMLLLFFLLCNRDMVREARAVYRLLDQNRIAEARVQVGRIVGRDTGDLEKAEIIRAAVESVSENIVDGFTAPMFYLAIGGVPMAYAYKTVNTIDSRFGYRNEAYERFGKVGARLDDLLNFIPARINAACLFCASGFRRRVLLTMLRFGRRHPSPNSGISEAGFAGYLGMALGGPSRYGGSLKRKPWIGRDAVSTAELGNPRLILRAIGLYWRTVGVTLFLFLALMTLLRLPLL